MSWEETSGSTIIETGGTYRTRATYHRTSGNSSDADMIHAISTSTSYSDIEDTLRNAYGTDVTIKRVTARKVGNNLYEQVIEFDCKSAHSITLAVCLLLVAANLIVAWYLLDKIEHLVDLDAFDIETPFGEINLLPIIIIAIAVIAIIMLVKK